MFVIALHGAIAWAMISIDNPPPVVPQKIPNVIHLELITVASTPDKTRSSTEPLPTKPANQPRAKNPTPPNSQPIIAIKKTETAEPIPLPEPEPEPVEPVKTNTELQPPPMKNKTAVARDSKTALTSDYPSTSDQTLTTVESRKIVNGSDKKEETEDDLSAMIRAVTAQFNREQAVQQQAAEKQANRKRMEQQQWQLQATNEAVNQMLALAAEQAEKQASNQADLVDTIDQNDADMVFSADEGSWMEAHEPITSISALIWSSVNKELGDVFIVTLELHVDKAGYITEVQILESSTSPIIDAIATTQVRAGQLNPLIHNGMAVDGIVPMSLVYERP